MCVYVCMYVRTYVYMYVCIMCVCMYLLIYSTLSASQATQCRVNGKIVSNTEEMVRKGAIMFPVCL